MPKRNSLVNFSLGYIGGAISVVVIDTCVQRFDLSVFGVFIASMLMYGAFRIVAACVVEKLGR